jgi:hypothetical protein
MLVNGFVLLCTFPDCTCNHTVVLQADCTNNVSLRSEATYIYDSRFDNNHYTLIYFDSPNLGLQQLIYIHFHVFVISRHLRKLINGYIHDSTRLPLLEPTVRAGLKLHNARQNSRTSSPTPPRTRRRRLRLRLRLRPAELQDIAAYAPPTPTRRRLRLRAATN